MEKTILTRVNGQGFVNGKIPRKVLERNAMDRVTCWEDKYSFDDCLDFVEEADEQTLMEFLKEYDAAEDTEAVIKKYMG